MASYRVKERAKATVRVLRSLDVEFTMLGEEEGCCGSVLLRTGQREAAKKIAREYGFFVARADLMPSIGRVLGPILGPRGKMPQPVPPTVDIKPIIERLRRSVMIRTRNQPVVQCRVGTEDMDDKKIAENIMAVLSAVDKKFRLDQHLDSLYVKLTMGPAVEVKMK